MQYTTKSGAIVFAGRNARENDVMTTTHPFPDDLWFHVKNEAGSHVILSGSVLPDDIYYAATMAAQHSKAKHQKGRIAVSYCPLYDVLKPKRAPAGQVQMLSETVIHVNLK